MSLPAWLNGQITAAQTDNEPTDATWSAYIWTPDGLVATAGAHDRQHAQTYLDGTRRTGLVAPSRSAQ
jgi:hypothetical protein